MAGSSSNTEDSLVEELLAPPPAPPKKKIIEPSKIESLSQEERLELLKRIVEGGYITARDICCALELEDTSDIIGSYNQVLSKVNGSK
jgi:hypothetical protein